MNEECDVEHINVFGLVFSTRQLVLCSEFWSLREMCKIVCADLQVIINGMYMSKPQNHVLALEISAFLRVSYECDVMWKSQQSSPRSIS